MGGGAGDQFVHLDGRGQRQPVQDLGTWVHSLGRGSWIAGESQDCKAMESGRFA
jgi:hypothetical protein